MLVCIDGLLSHVISAMLYCHPECHVTSSEAQSLACISRNGMSDLAGDTNYDPTSLSPSALCKGGLPLQSHTMGDFAKDSLPCIHMVGLAAGGA